jgi:hypothetical protein
MGIKKPRPHEACPYPKLKRPSGQVAGRAFLRDWLSGLPLFKRDKLAKKGIALPHVEHLGTAFTLT